MTDGVGGLAVLVLVGFLSGVINTLAGGGSLVTLPVLLQLGMPAAMANGTNRVGVLLASLTAAGSYRGSGQLDGGLGATTWVPACIGAVLGAWVSIDLDEALFRRLVGGMMLVLLVLVLARPGVWLEGRARTAPGWARTLGFLAIGAYGGFLQAGVGLFLLAGFVLLDGRDLLTANARKVVMTAVFTVPAMVVFVGTGSVAWVPGLALALGSALGGWAGARLTVSWGPSLVRAAFVIVVVISSVRLLLGG